MGRFERILLFASVVLTGSTGLVFAWMKYLMKSSDPYSVVNHPWQPYFLSAHVLASPALLFAAGLITREHILGKYRDPKARRGRRTGILAAWLLLPMVASGYAIQVLTSQGPRQWVIWAHLAAGAFFLLLYVAHVLLPHPARQREGMCRGNGQARPVPGAD